MKDREIKDQGPGNEESRFLGNLFSDSPSFTTTLVPGPRSLIPGSFRTTQVPVPDAPIFPRPLVPDPWSLIPRSFPKGVGPRSLSSPSLPDIVLDPELVEYPRHDEINQLLDLRRPVIKPGGGGKDYGARARKSQHVRQMY